MLCFRGSDPRTYYGTLTLHVRKRYSYFVIASQKEFKYLRKVRDEFLSADIRWRLNGRMLHL